MTGISLLRAFDPRKAHSPLSVAIDYGWFYKRSRRLYATKEISLEKRNSLDWCYNPWW